MEQYAAHRKAVKETISKEGSHFNDLDRSNRPTDSLETLA